MSELASGRRQSIGLSTLSPCPQMALHQVVACTLTGRYVPVLAHHEHVQRVNCTPLASCRINVTAGMSACPDHLNRSPGNRGRHEGLLRQRVQCARNAAHEMEDIPAVQLTWQSETHRHHHHHKAAVVGMRTWHTVCAPVLRAAVATPCSCAGRLQVGISMGQS